MTERSGSVPGRFRGLGEGVEVSTEKERRIREELQKRWPASRVERIWNLYLEIKQGKKKVVADLIENEKVDAGTLESVGLINFSSRDHHSETKITLAPF